MALGQRVAIPWLGFACGHCDYRVSGRETVCESQQHTDYSIDGSFGQYATGYGRYVVAVPDGIDPVDAGPLTCAGVTTYKAVKVAGTRSPDLVAVFSRPSSPWPYRDAHSSKPTDRCAAGEPLVCVAPPAGNEVRLTRVTSETRPLDEVNAAIADVEAGRVAARVVLEP